VDATSNMTGWIDLAGLPTDFLGVGSVETFRAIADRLGDPSGVGPERGSDQGRP
jgi:hypothetical protein